MRLELKRSYDFPATKTEMICISEDGETFTKIISDIEGMVEEGFIRNLRDMADEIDENNQDLANRTDFN